MTKVKGIERASLNVQTGKLTLSHAPSVTDEAITSVIKRHRFKVIALNPPTS